MVSFPRYFNRGHQCFCYWYQNGPNFVPALSKLWLLMLAFFVRQTAKIKKSSTENWSLLPTNKCKCSLLLSQSNLSVSNNLQSLQSTNFKNNFKTRQELGHNHVLQRHVVNIFVSNCLALNLAILKHWKFLKNYTFGKFLRTIWSIVFKGICWIVSTLKFEFWSDDNSNKNIKERKKERKKRRK
jgi:hypothetical protein